MPPTERILERIELVPVGDLDAATADVLVRRLSRHVGVPCRVAPGIAAVSVPLVRDREQADADATLALLEARATRPGVTSLGVTHLDLGHPLFTFFFGRARMGGAALVSLRRLDPAYYGLPRDPETALRRAVLECLHELGHVAGLRHCDLWSCVMHFSGDVSMLDVRGTAFCASCAAAVPRASRHALHAGPSA